MEEEELGFDFTFTPEDLNVEFIEDEIIEDQEDIQDQEDINTVEDEDPEEVNSEEDNDDEDDENSNESSEDDASSSNIYSSLALLAQEQGILSSSLDLSKVKITSADEFSELLNQEVLIKAQEKVDEYLNNIDLNKIATHRKEINAINELTEQDFKSDIDLAKKIIEQDLINQDLPERVVKNYMRRLTGAEDEVIIEEALNSKESIIQFNKIKEEEEIQRYENENRARMEQAQKDLENLKSSIYDKKEILPGFIPNKTVRDNIYRQITTPVHTDENGNSITKLVKDSLEDPIGFQIRLHAIYELTDGFTNINKIATKQKSNAVKELENAFANRPDYNAGSSYKVDRNSYDGPLKYDTLNINNP